VRTRVVTDRAEDNLVVVAAFLASRAHHVVVGGCALRMRGVDHRPADLDIVPEPSPGNLRRLFDAIDALGSVGRQSRANEHARAIADIVTRLTPLGSIDVLLRRGRDEYASLARAGSDVSVNSRSVRVASLDDVMRLRARFGKDADDA
jgi:hypothetical protein